MAAWRLWVAGTAVAGALLLAALTGAEFILRAAGAGSPTAFFVELSDGAVATNQHFGWRFFPRSLARTPVPARIAAKSAYRIVILGSSAAMGVPEPSFSFGRLLEGMLRFRFPERRFEVINAAMTAVNSHVVLPIARDVARLNPDLVIVYEGNNEVVGPYGPGSVFRGGQAPLPLIRWSVWWSGLRLGGMSSAALEALSTPPEGWGGMSMFLERRIPRDDLRLDDVVRSFERNLDDIIAAAGAPVLLCTVAVNLRDCPPFASQHRAGLTGEDLDRWQEAVDSEDFAAALAIDDNHAESQYRHARALDETSRMDEARKHYVQARDLDTLRFRTDSRLNDAIRRHAAKASLVDLEPLLDGGEDFYEHVHFTFHGNYRVAARLFAEVAQRTGLPGEPPSPDEMRETTAFTSWDEYRLMAEMARMMEQPPFTGQFGHGDRVARMRARVRDLSLAADPSGSAKILESALVSRPDDLLLRQRYAELLDATGRPDAAATEWQRLLEQLPNLTYWLTALGASSRDAGRLDAARDAFTQALRVDNRSVAAHVGLGTVAQKSGDTAAAERHYRDALRIQPAAADARNNLGLLLLRLGKREEALVEFEQASRLRPDSGEADNNAGLALLEAGRIPDALARFAEAVRRDPLLAGARHNYGATLARSGRIAEARLHLAEAVRLAQENAAARYSLASLLAGLGEIENAITQYEAAIRLQPTFAEAHYDLGLLRASQGKLSEAIVAYEQALAARPEYAEAWNNLGVAQARLGRIADATASFRKALEARPSYAEAAANLRSAEASR
ncbi:MAG: tetratricopeptide repeat protein [Bryobacterales bacterium]|nr:tetratricopeptide repeat protein [Bryobacterales bacterium]